jgi:hypothetical protein
MFILSHVLVAAEVVLGLYCAKCWMTYLKHALGLIDRGWSLDVNGDLLTLTPRYGTQY